MDFSSLIEVRAPYFALQSVAMPRPGLVTARIGLEQPPGHEAGAIPSAEAGRHLAILGSCACASLAPAEGKHYYLAHRARLTRSPQAQNAIQHGPLDAEARAVQRDRRSASARAVVRDAQGHDVYDLDVSYQVLSERLFQRMFSAQRRDVRESVRGPARADAGLYLPLRRNPYTRPLPVQVSRVSASGAAASLPRVDPEWCAGHFPLYPAMPIAMLMQALGSLCGDVLRKRVGADCHYVVMQADVRADHLAFAGQSLSFEAEWKGQDDALHTFAARARLADGTLAGEGDFTMRRVQIVAPRLVVAAPPCHDERASESRSAGSLEPPRRPSRRSAR